MKAREPRRRVLITARMRSGATWSDIVIHNISSRGLMVESAHPPLPGTYIEVRRAAETIIGRIVWQSSRNFGMLSQDRIDIDAVLQEPRPVAIQPPVSPDTPPDRRRAARAITHRAERSRHAASLLQYVAIAAASFVVASLAATEVYTLLIRPFHQVSTHLSKEG